MNRYGETNFTPNFSINVVTAVNPKQHPSMSFKDLDELLT